MAHKGRPYPIDQRFRYINLFRWQNGGNGWIARQYDLAVAAWLAGSIAGLATGHVTCTNDPWSGGDRAIRIRGDFSGTTGKVVLVTWKLELDPTGFVLNASLECTVDGVDQVTSGVQDYTSQGADSAIFDYGSDYLELPGFQACPIAAPEWNAIPWP